MNLLDFNFMPIASALFRKLRNGDIIYNVIHSLKSHKNGLNVITSRISGLLEIIVIVMSC